MLFLGLSLRQNEELPLDGGLTESLFPDIEQKWSSDHQIAFGRFIERNDQLWYRFDWVSIMDVLYFIVSSHASRLAVGRFYHNDGPPLIDCTHYNEAHRQQTMARMDSFLNLLLKLLQEDYELAWRQGKSHMSSRGHFLWSAFRNAVWSDS
jgi:hypothetical protein